MPNHCQNLLVFERRNAIDVNKIQEKITTLGELDFSRWLPEIPENDNWWQWRVDNWGTRSNAYETSIYIGFDVEDRADRFYDLEIRFQTAWGPPLVAIEQLYAFVGWPFKFHYFEGGWGSFGGIEEFGEKQKIIFTQELDLDFPPKWLMEEFGFDSGFI